MHKLFEIILISLYQCLLWCKRRVAKYHYIRDIKNLLYSSTVFYDVSSKKLSDMDVSDISLAHEQFFKNFVHVMIYYNVDLNWLYNHK